MGLKSNFNPKEITTLIDPENNVLIFESREDAAEYLINKGVPRSTSIKTVAGALGEKKFSKESYFGYYCK